VCKREDYVGFNISKGDHYNTMKFVDFVMIEGSDRATCAFPQQIGLVHDNPTFD
jgi:hypothetical protein